MMVVCRHALKQTSSPNHALYCQRNDLEANESPEGLAGPLHAWEADVL